MTSLEIQFELRKREINQKDIAHELGVSAMSVSKVIKGDMVSDRIMRSISEKIDRQHFLVFPDYYLRPPKRKTSKTTSIL